MKYYNETLRLAKLIGLDHYVSDARRVVWRQAQDPSAYPKRRDAWKYWRPFEVGADTQPVVDWLNAHHPGELGVLPIRHPNEQPEEYTVRWCRAVLKAFGEPETGTCRHFQLYHIDDHITGERIEYSTEPVDPNTLTPAECEIALSELAERLAWKTKVLEETRKDKAACIEAMNRGSRNWHLRLADETEQREMHAVSIREYYAPGLAAADTEIDRLISENHGVESERDKLREALQSLYDWHAAVHGRYERQYRDAVREAEKALRSSPGEPAESDTLLAENARLRAFRDSVFAKMHENAGNLVNPFAYMPQEEWNKIKAAHAAERNE